MSNRLLGNLEEGLVFVISAPAGTGKTTLVHMIAKEFSCVTVNISCTTRLPRPGEVNGRDYYFLTSEQFEERVKSGDFLEHANVFGYEYGTSKNFVEGERKKGKHVILVIDTQGALQLKQESYPAVFIFLSPPSLDELHRRLLNRKTEDPAVLQKRLSMAAQEMAQVIYYDYQIINDDLTAAYETLRSILIAEEHRVRVKNNEIPQG